MNDFDVILDCYSDEPSGYGVPPYLGVHQRYISSALKYLGRNHFYVTIDDLRKAKGREIQYPPGNTDISTINLTSNCDNSLQVLSRARTIYIVMGCFVEYTYVSAVPPKENELFQLIKEFKGKKVLVYVLGGKRGLPSRFYRSNLFKEVNTVVSGLAYNFLIDGQIDSFSANYGVLAAITKEGAPILEQIGSPRIMEIETMIGCNWAKCSFCVERVRGYVPVFRPVRDVIEDVAILYDQGARYFRLGRNPNFYWYMNQDVLKMEELLYGIRSRCPHIKVLHIDNVNPENVVTQQGRQITALIAKYCTSGNIAPFGIESFDPVVREKNSLNSNVDQIMEAISVMNEYGGKRGENGAPQFLNGINLIHNLPGQRDETLHYNLEHLHRIFEAGLQTQRLFYRELSPPSGISVAKLSVARTKGAYEEWRERIYVDYSIPMQRKVFPCGSILKNVRVEAWKEGNSILRQLGTCPPRVVVKKMLLPIGKEYDIQVLDTLAHRTLEGKPLGQVS